MKEKGESKKRRRDRQENGVRCPLEQIYTRSMQFMIIKHEDNGCDHNLLKLQRIIEKEPSCVTLKDEEGETPLHYAAYYGRHTFDSVFVIHTQRPQSRKR